MYTITWKAGDNEPESVTLGEMTSEASAKRQTETMRLSVILRSKSQPWWIKLFVDGQQNPILEINR